ncbi:hypothetical protein [Sphingomonas sp. R86520]|uniref:hypothetical protein n=1 Tax=Sphingomonas sp. R86520 TaxID=3093859 RepID=UPI0036D4093B
MSAAAIASFAPTGWANPDLGRAYFAVEAALKEQAQPAESPITEALSRALAAIEEADCEVEKYS